MQNDKYDSTKSPEKATTKNDNKKRGLDKEIGMDAPGGNNVLSNEFAGQNTTFNDHVASKVPSVASPSSKTNSKPQQEMIPYPSRLEPDFKKPENYQRIHRSKSNGNQQYKRDGSNSRDGNNSRDGRNSRDGSNSRNDSSSRNDSNSRNGHGERYIYNGSAEPFSTFKRTDNNLNIAVATRPDTDDYGDLKKLEMMTAADFDRDRYARFGTHESEVKDYVRTMAYKSCIECCADSRMKDKVVLVVRSGIGLLPMLCVRSGHAKMVIALEESACIEYARRIISDNNFNHKITLIQSSVQDLKSLPHGLSEVDVILSDFMGDCVLSQGIEMEQVIVARDRFLKPNGLMIPMRVALYGQLSEQRKAYDNQRVCKSKKMMRLVNNELPDAVDYHGNTNSSDDHGDTNLSWWRDVYGFDMRSEQTFLVDHSKNEDGSDVDKEGFLILEPIVTYFSPRKIVSISCLLKEFDMSTCTIEDVRHVQCKDLKFKCITPNTSANDGDYAHMIELYMKVDFPCKRLNRRDFIGFSTASHAPCTRYRQTGLLLRDQLLINEGDVFTLDDFHMWRGPQKQENTLLHETVGDNHVKEFDYSENLKLRLQYTFVNRHTNAVNRRCAYILERNLF